MVVTRTNYIVRTLIQQEIVHTCVSNVHSLVIHVEGHGGNVDGYTAAAVSYRTKEISSECTLKGC